MNIEEIREYCLAKKEVTEGLPFGDDTLVFKAKGKIFALMNLDGEPRVNLKCDPERALTLREEYDSIIPGYHMNKKHWNTMICGPALPDSLLKEMIDHSYELIVGKNRSK
jgi:predicted DNA-binding protein (MmcQ/YjbR family)